MIEQVSTAISFMAFFYDATNKVGKAGLTDVTVDAWRLSDTNKIVDNQAASELAGGFYYYVVGAAYASTESPYLAVFKTANTDVSQRQVPAMWAVGVAGVENLDATVSTRGTLANQTGILNRIGAFAGSGVNTVLGFLKALMSTAASTPSGVGGTFSAATDSVEAIRNVLDAGDITTVDTVVGDVVTVRPYTTWSITLTGLGSLAGRSALYFTVKRNPKSETDAEAILQVEETAGLLYINGAAAADSGKATLVVSDEDAGDLTVTVDMSVTGLSPENYLSYDVKKIKAGDTRLMVSGHRKFNIGETSTRATS